MIIAKFEHNDEKGSLTLRVKGHAGANVYGKDLVCAVVSFNATALAQAFKFDYAAGKLRRAPRIKIHGGDAIVTAFPKKEYFGDVLTEFMYARTGFVLLAHNFPKYVMLAGDDDITPLEG